MYSKRIHFRLGKKQWLVLMCFFSMPLMNAQYTTTLEVTDAPSAAIKNSMEKNGTSLLTELNNAQGEKRGLRLSGIDIESEAATSLQTMWEICPFRCDELDIIEPCLNTAAGYQIRNIPVIMEPLNGERYEEDQYQEIVLNYDKSGKIKDICFALNSVLYKQVMRSNLEVTDLRRRSMVLEFVEQFRTAYNRKDINYLQDVFSDDALIITGKVLKREKTSDGVQLKPEISYTSQSKSQYLSRLATVFKNNARINVIFEDVKVNKHRQKEHIYGVTLVQKWNSTSYSDEGYLFLLWDFSDEDRPQIHVRTWQPYQETPKEEVFGLSSFVIKD